MINFRTNTKIWKEPLNQRKKTFPWKNSHFLVQLGRNEISVNMAPGAIISRLTFELKYKSESYFCKIVLSMINGQKVQLNANLFLDT
jgi:hypothetical protein